MHLKCAEPWDWIATCKILANRKYITFLPTFYPRSNLVSQGSWRKLLMKLFPVLWDVDMNNGENWWHQECFISHLPSLEALCPGIGYSSTSAFWLRSSAPSVKDSPVKLCTISRGDGASPPPAVSKPSPLCSEQTACRTLNTPRIFT